MQTEIANLTAGLAAGGDLPSIIAAIRSSEQRRQAFETQRAALTQAGALVTTQTAAELQDQVMAKLADWRAVMRQGAPEARQVLRRSSSLTAWP